MNTAIFTSFLAINYLQVTWFLTYKKIFTLQESLLLSVFLFIQFLSSLFINSPFILFIQFSFYFLQFFLSIKRLNSWLSPILLISYENSLLLLALLPTLDAWDILNYSQKISTSTYNAYLILFILAEQVLLLLLILLTNFLDKKFSITRTMSLLPKKYKLLSLLLLFLLLLAITFKLMSILNGDSVSLFYSSFIIFGHTLLIGFNLVIVIKYNSEKQYIALLSKTYEQEKSKLTLSNKFRQDYQLLLQQLKESLESDDDQKALELLNSVLNNSNSLLTPNLYKKITYLNSPPIQGLLTSFVNKCHSAGITLDLYITTDLTNLDMNMIDFIRCFSILLDNAFEATEQTNSPYIEIKITSIQQLISVEVQNTYIDDEVILFQTLIKNNVSTKAGHQGKGLYIFLTILSRYKNSSYTINKRNNHFIVKFKIPKIEQV
ncbi:two-component system, LytTR family, sensor histidine kinase AgrC [Enterococcus sp. DIV0724b]|uniref:GHKL domain-containing protein n=1 Tax=Enterococcus sp. DIV0724b TaxID=2774694 RepID=UPI003D2FA2E1